jgi:hypothetical protein
MSNARFGFISCNRCRPAVQAYLPAYRRLLGPWKQPNNWVALDNA